MTIVLAVVLLFHGLGHVLFLGPALRLVDWAGQTGQSWLLTATLGDGPSRAVASVVWTASIALFVAGAGGLLAGQAWWRGLTIAGAVLSLVGIAVFWDGIATTNAVFALVVDALVLGALLVAHWPSSEMVGS